jgi:hypothetical protein
MACSLRIIQKKSFRLTQHARGTTAYDALRVLIFQPAHFSEVLPILQDGDDAPSAPRHFLWNDKTRLLFALFEMSSSCAYERTGQML